MLKKYQIYIYSQFIKTFLITTFIFFCIIIIVNFFDEIRFAEKYNAEIYFIIYLSLLNAPGENQKVFIIRKQGKIWTDPGKPLSQADSDIGRFLRATSVDLPR